MKALIKKLVEAWGPSGFEHQVRELIKAEVQDLCDEMWVDNLGNLICRVGEKTDDNLRIMTAAHMDEIGLIISHVDRNGYMRFSNIGGLFPSYLAANRVKFENGTMGVVSVHDPWRRSGDIPKQDDYFIDVSINGDDNADVKVGDPAIFWRTYEERGDRLIAKSMDDRIGCVVNIEAMRKLKELGGSPHQVFFVFTVQEEVGVRGAQTAGYGVDADLALALDVCPTGDVPKGPKLDVSLGGGAAIKIKDTGHIVPPAVRDLLIAVAEKHNIPHQFEILTGGTTDARAISVTRAGVPAGVISIPCRYVHSVSETVDINDVQACVDLLTHTLASPIEAIRPQ